MALGGVLTAVVLVRVAAFFVFRDTFDFVRSGHIHGSEAYDTYAVNLLATGVFGRVPGVPDVAIPPFYALALAGLYAIAGRGAVQVILLHTLLDALSVWMVVDLGRRLFPHGAVVGLLAAWATALYPYLIFQSLSVIDGPLFMCLLCAFVWLVTALRDRRRTDVETLLLGGASGAALGLGTLTRPILLPLAILVPVWFLLRRSWGTTLARLAPAALVALAIVGIWTLRNVRAFGVLVPMTSTVGGNLWQGNSALTLPLLRAGYDVQWTAPDGAQASDWANLGADRDRLALTIQYLRDHPDRILELAAVKFLVYWSVDIFPRHNPTPSPGPVLAIPDNRGEFQIPSIAPLDPIVQYSQPLFEVWGRWIHRLYWGGLFVAGLLGSVLAISRWRDVSLIWLAELAMTLVYVAFHPATRYRAPSDPLWFLFSASAIVWAVARFRIWSAPGRVETFQAPAANL